MSPGRHLDFVRRHEERATIGSCTDASMFFTS
jgi:hypothetical protein